MIFTETILKGAYVIDIKRLEDDRGFFGRSFCRNEFESYGLNPNVAQCNISFNKKRGTLRGMHMQQAPYGETKLIRCSRGRIYDVIIDLRSDSETYTKWVGVELSAESYRMLYVPQGFAHGFITLEDETDVEYQISEFFTQGASAGYLWNDPAFNIQWPIEPVVISEKDSANPRFYKSNDLKVIKGA
jgi:dTDP-4-dehydrorhamnose 3,5-epimerase